MVENRNINDNLLQLILIVMLIGMAAAGIAASGWRDSLSGLMRLQVHPARLINDFVDIAGAGGAFLNAALVGFLGLLIVRLTGIPVSGPTYAAIFTMTGFGLFGKTPLNILPIVAGVFLSAKLVNKRFVDYLIIALFGTALGPLVSTLAWELGLPLVPAILTGAAGGIVTGFFLPSLAFSMLHLHQGYNLYNMGLTCGFFGLFAAAILRGFGHAGSGPVFWHGVTTPVSLLVVPLISLFLLAFGTFRAKGASFKQLRKVLKIPGRLPSDFADLVSLEGAMINSGLLGLLGSLYIYLIDAPFNGPVIGGLLTIMGFGAFGTHIKNSWPVVSGVVAATLATGNALNAPGPVLAAIFSTTLAPLAGEFGILTGMTAGFIHLLMVLQTSSWHGGMNLYNNGFAGGLTAAFIVSVIQWYKSNKEDF